MEQLTTIKRRHNFAYLFWISFISLFLELALIRWIGTEVRIFAFFKNIVLISCFVGLGIGFSLKRFRAGLLGPIILITVIAALIHPSVQVSGISIGKIPEFLTVFPEFNMWISHKWLLENENMGMLVVGIIASFAMITLLVIAFAWIFIPFGQILGDIFTESDNRIRDYSINLAGSLLGIWAFAFLSYLATPPWIWFLIGVGGTIPLIGTRGEKIAGTVILIVLMLLTIERGEAMTRSNWTPYQMVKIHKQNFSLSNVNIPYLILNVNHSFYMFILNLSYSMADKYPGIFNRQDAPYYSYDLPYRFKPHPTRVLVVGAGGGNDVAAALRNNAGYIDAVEIDPGIARIGVLYHPEKPYSDPRVNLVIDDARSFFKKTNNKYDMIVFGLLDSHTLTSNFTNTNLDSYVYTKESLTEAKSHLNDGGIISISFCTVREWLGYKIYLILKDVFNQSPMVRSCPTLWGKFGFFPLGTC